ncbi:hypothetical protein JCM8202v2_001652 [Rhodotorula sphaerocarpa]
MIASTGPQRSPAAKGLFRYGHNSLPLVLLLSAFHLYRLAFIGWSNTHLRVIRRVSFLPFRRRRAPSLPVELIAQILGSWETDAVDAREAHYQRLAFYHSCMLVHSTWYQLARQFLHREMYISRRGDRRLQKDEHSHITADVCAFARLAVLDSSHDTGVWTSQTISGFVGACEWLDSLSLVHINLRLQDFERFPTPWPSADKRAYVLPRLEHLSVVSVSFSSVIATYAGMIDPAALPNLLTLELWSCSLFWASFRGVRAFPKVRSMSFSADYLPVQHLQEYDLPDLRFLNLSSTTIEDLSRGHFDHRPFRFAPVVLRIEVDKSFVIYGQALSVRERIDQLFVALLVLLSRNHWLLRDLDEMHVPAEPEARQARALMPQIVRWAAARRIRLKFYEGVDPIGRRDAGSAWFSGTFAREAERFAHADLPRVLTPA